MRELLAVVILATVAEAFYDEIADYWYENNDGIVLDNDNAASLRYEILNGTNVLRTGYRGQDSKAVSILKSVRATRHPAEESLCTVTNILNFGCTECVCVGGQLYLCTTTVCHPMNNNRRHGIDGLKFISYRSQKRHEKRISAKRQKLKKGKKKNKNHKGILPLPFTRPTAANPEPKCSEGERIPADDSCNECICFDGNFVCSKRDCDLTNVQFEKCKIGAWYNPKGDDYCRYCYCLDENISFCFMYLCLARETTLFAKSEPKCFGTQEFTLSLRNNCKGCTCRNGKWECWEKSAGCSDSQDCPSKSLVENKNGFCSACYCGEEENICATDVRCAKQLES